MGHVSNSPLRKPCLSLIGIRAMKKLTARFIKDQSGATAVEYCLVAGLIALVIIGSVTRVGTNLSSKYNVIANKLT